MADFRSELDSLQELGARVIAASVDSEEDAGKTVSRHDLEFDVAYGLDLSRVAAATGAFYEPDDDHLHATGFLIDPEGKVAGAVYSTGAIGRYVAADVVGKIEYLQENG